MTAAGRTRLDRASLYGVLLPLALVVAPHFANLQVWIPALAVACGLYRLAAAQRGWPIPGALVRAALAIAGFGGVYLMVGGISGREGGVSLLVVMIGLKVLEARDERDAAILLLMSYFLVATNFLFSQALALTAYLAVGFVVTTAGLVSLSRGRSLPGWSARTRHAGALLAQAVPIMLVLFVLFPRLQGSIWGNPESEDAATTGLSDTMSPGTISELSLSDEVAFRVRFADGIPANRDLYWRGPVLSRYDGRTWHHSESETADPPEAGTGDGSVRYTVYLEPHGRKWLLALDVPVAVDADARYTRDRQILTEERVTDSRRYRARSQTQYTGNGTLADRARRRYLQLPDGGNPRTRELARRWDRQEDTDRAVIERALERFREQGFVYTLQPRPLRGADDIDRFVFGTKEGFCEHFAGSFTFMMRAAGIPARVVTGYQGGSRNPLGGYLIVRQSDAHAWSEVWLPGRGWVRVDPTSAVSPARVEAGIGAAMAGSDALPDMALPGTSWAKQLMLSWDAVHQFWDMWVLGFGPQMQRRFLRATGLDGLSHPARLGVLAGSIAAVLAVLALVMSWRARLRPPDVESALYRRFCRRLAQLGVRPLPHEAPSDLAQRAAAALPEHAGDIERITELYLRARYGRQPPRHCRSELRAAVGRFRRRTALRGFRPGSPRAPGPPRDEPPASARP